MRYGLTFLALGLALALLAATVANPWLRVLYADSALCFSLFGMAYVRHTPAMLRKRADGTLPLASITLFWPYLLCHVISVWSWARLRRERAYDEVAPNLYVGRRLIPGDQPPPGGFTAVLDMTCEFPERADLRKAAYLCLPLLDSTAPDGAQLAEGVRFLREHAAGGPTLVHCALGHGRSAAVAAAYLLAEGMAVDELDAERRLRVSRPGIHLNSFQRAAVAAYKSAIQS